MGVESGSLKAEFWNLRVKFIHVRLDFGLWKSILGILDLILTIESPFITHMSF